MPASAVDNKLARPTDVGHTQRADEGVRLAIPALRIDSLSQNFGSVEAVKSLSLEVQPGELFGVIGPDGAGKTTTFRILAGLIHPDDGRASIFGLNPESNPREVHEIIGYMPQRFSLYSDLTVAENLRFFADLYLVPESERSKREARLMEFSRLGPFRDRRAGQLSGGMKQKLALSCTLIHTPKLLILDEPTTGVDPVSRKEFWTILKSLSEEKITIIVSTPYMDEALLCDGVALMSKGRLITISKPADIPALYPYQLVEITSMDLESLRSRLIDSGFQARMIHRLAERLHVACADKSEIGKAQTIAKESGGTATPCEPSIEDTFIALAGRSEAA